MKRRNSDVLNSSNRQIKTNNKQILEQEQENKEKRVEILERKVTNPYLKMLQDTHNLQTSKTITRSLEKNTSSNCRKISKFEQCKGDYIRGSLIGSGIVGNIYSGMSKISGEIVAIKTINFNENSDNGDLKIEIQNLTNVYSKLKHKNIINIKGFQETKNKNSIEIITEYTTGGSIKQLLSKFGVFDEKLIKIYVRQILEALDYLQEKNIIHRNIKNTNILIDENGIVKLTDFILHNLPKGFSLTENTNYKLIKELAPEIALNNLKGECSLLPVSSASDIWSLGCIIIEMSSKNPPWWNIAKTTEDVIYILKTTNVPPKFPSFLSIECKDFLNKCLTRNPVERPTSKKLLTHPFLFSEIENFKKLGFSEMKNNILEDKNLKKIGFLKKPNFIKNGSINEENTNKYEFDDLTLPKIQITQEKSPKLEENKNKMINIFNNKSGGFSVSVSMFSNEISKNAPKSFECDSNYQNIKILPDIIDSYSKNHSRSMSYNPNLESEILKFPNNNQETNNNNENLLSYYYFSNNIYAYDRNMNNHLISPSSNIEENRCKIRNNYYYPKTIALVGDANLLNTLNKPILNVIENGNDNNNNDLKNNKCDEKVFDKNNLNTALTLNLKLSSPRKSVFHDTINKISTLTDQNLKIKPCLKPNIDTNSLENGPKSSTIPLIKGFKNLITTSQYNGPNTCGTTTTTNISNSIINKNNNFFNTSNIIKKNSIQSLNSNNDDSKRNESEINLKFVKYPCPTSSFIKNQESNNLIPSINTNSINQNSINFTELIRENNLFKENNSNSALPNFNKKPLAKEGDNINYIESQVSRVSISDYGGLSFGSIQDLK